MIGVQPNSQETRRTAVSGIADHTGCQWHSRSSKVNDFHFTWKGVRHFLLVINSNLGRISHLLQYMASFPLKKSKIW